MYYNANTNRQSPVTGSPNGQMSTHTGPQTWDRRSQSHCPWGTPNSAGNTNNQHDGRMPLNSNPDAGRQTHQQKWRGPPPPHFYGPPPGFRGNCNAWNASMRGPPPRCPQGPPPRPQASQHMSNSPQFSHRGRGRFPHRRGPMRGGYASPGVKRDQSESGRNSAKKQKMSASAESRPFYCKACDKGYNDEDFYKQHIATHISCSIDGCPYVAAQRLVELHREMQHHSGLAKKIWQLESKEDIEKWRLERKKNFPTKENIDKKNIMLQEKTNRGEVLETKSFGKFGRCRRGRGRGRRGGRGRYQQERTDEQHRDNRTISNQQNVNHMSQSPSQKEKSTTQRIHDSRPDVNGTEKDSDHMNSADPLSYVLDLPTNKGSDGQTPGKDRKTSLVSPDMDLSIGGALGSLMCTYSDTSEETDEDEDDDHTDKLQRPKTGRIEAQASHADERSIVNCGHSSPAVSPLKSHTHNSYKQKPHNHQYSVPKRSLSLLEKLLASEIRHERNVILQCVRYIVKKDFFGTRDNNNVNDFQGCAEDLKYTVDSIGAEI